MHEIIETFKQPPGADKSYAYLMCWGLFLGQAIEGEWTVLNRVLWLTWCSHAIRVQQVRPFSIVWCSAIIDGSSVRENYLLHQPIRMTLATLVCFLQSVTLS